MPIMDAPTRTFLNRFLNLALLLSGAFMLGTGWIMDQRLPRGRPGHGLTLLGLDRHGWGDLHLWVGYTMGALVIAHLALHTAWLKRIASFRRPWLLALGFGTATAIVAFFVFFPIATTVVQRSH